MSRLTYAFVKVVSSPFKVFHICAQCFFCQGLFMSRFLCSYINEVSLFYVIIKYEICKQFNLLPKLIFTQVKPKLNSLLHPILTFISTINLKI